MVLPLFYRFGTRFTKFWAGISAVSRRGTWWDDKLACLLGTAYAVAYCERVPVAALGPLLLQVFGSFLPGAAYVCVLNDLTDAREDLRAGKPNQMAHRSVAFRIGALALCLGLGAVAGWRYRADPLTLVLYAANWVAFTLYSVPPFRLKTRGGWGVAADACGGQFLPTLWIAAYLSEGTGHTLDPRLGTALAIWALALGLRGILCHQLRDGDNDRLAGVGTLVVRRGPERVRRFVGWKCFPVEAAALLGWLLQIAAPLTWLLLAFHLVAVARRPGGLLRWRDWKAPQPEVWCPLAEYYRSYFPVTFALALAWREPAALWLAAAHLLLFWRGSLQFLLDCRQLVRPFLRVGNTRLTDSGAAP